MKYKVFYENYDGDYLDTIIDVPDYIPVYDPLDIEDVPLYIKANIEDLCFLEDYREVETA